MGQLFVDPASLPAGPFLAYDHDGALVSTIYMLPMKDLNPDKRFEDLAAPSGNVDRNGVRILPDQVVTSWPEEQLLPAIGGRQSAEALDQALHEIAARYGMRTADFVTMQLEYTGIIRDEAEARAAATDDRRDP